MKRLVLVWSAVLLLRAIPLLGLEMTPLTLRQLTEEADLVVEGKVLSTTCARDAEGRVFTRVELDVKEVWKGSWSGSTFLVVHGGGVLGDREFRVSGQASYAPGEEIVAFVVLNVRGEGVTLGLAQGKFTVAVDPATGERLARNPFHGRGTGAASREQGGRSPERLALTELKETVRRFAR